MLRSTHSLLKRAAQLSRSSVSSAPRHSLHSPNSAFLLLTGRAVSANASSPPAEDDRARHAAVADVFPLASDAGAGSLPSPGSRAPSTILAAQVPSGMGAAAGCFRDGANPSHEPSGTGASAPPTGCEDYDAFELHHPPCEKTRETSHEPSGTGASAPQYREQGILHSDYYSSIDESTGCEDYDAIELHHPPCEKTQEMYEY